MLSETLTTGLEQYAIGPKIRALRQDKGLSLVQLGGHTGLSPAMISKIERSQLFPTLPTLLRIALVFGVGLERFFNQDVPRPRARVVRREDRIRLPDRRGTKSPAYFFESLDFSATDRKMDAFYAEFPVSSKPSEPHKHAGCEFLYVIDGQLGLTIDDEEVELGTGDAVYFDSGAPHNYRRMGKSVCTVIVVVAGGKT